MLKSWYTRGIAALVAAGVLVTAWQGPRTLPRVAGQEPTTEDRVMELERRLEALESYVDEYLSDVEARLAALESTGPRTAPAAPAASPQPATRTPRVFVDREDIFGGASRTWVIGGATVAEAFSGTLRICTELYTRRVPGDTGVLRVSVNSVSGQGNTGAIAFSQTTVEPVCQDLQARDASRIEFVNRTSGSFTVSVTER